MRLLIDTQIFIWAVIDSDQLSEHARRIMLDAAEVFVSAASIWEIAIKAKLGKLEGDPRAFAAAIVESGFRELVISSRHTCMVYELPLYIDDVCDWCFLKFSHRPTQTHADNK
jgi:PIN domain nuclease of toxin-antitoxin system